MKNLKLFVFFLSFALAISCSTIKTAVNTVTDKNPVKSKYKATEIPKDIQNSVPDKHAAEENAVIISQNDGYVFYIGEDAYPLEVVGDKLQSLFKKNPSERELVYLNANARMDFGNVVKLLDVMRKENVENVGLWVQPAAKSEPGFNILKVKIPAEPKDSDAVSKRNPLNLVLSLSKDGKIKLNNEEIYEDDKKEKLAKIFRTRESNGAFREGTNEVEKTITIKGTKSGSYANVVKLIDLAVGAGASPVFVQIDDLEM
jgi:biopolymer transport protein ExbD